jgi:hypothetical protein
MFRRGQKKWELDIIICYLPHMISFTKQIENSRDPLQRDNNKHLFPTQRDKRHENKFTYSNLHLDRISWIPLEISKATEPTQFLPPPHLNPITLNVSKVPLALVSDDALDDYSDNNLERLFQNSQKWVPSKQLICM